MLCLSHDNQQVVLAGKRPNWSRGGLDQNFLNPTFEGYIANYNPGLASYVLVKKMQELSERVFTSGIYQL